MPPCCRYARVFLIVLLSLFSVPARADWPPITPEELAMTSLPQQPGAPAVILLRQEDDDDSKHFHSFYIRIKVLTEAGRRYADVELPYSKSDAGFTIDTISGRTVHPDGTVIPFQGKAFEKTLVKGHGIRQVVKAFTLPDVQPGSILDFKYSLRYGDNYAVPPEWVVQRELFQKAAEFRFVPFGKDLILAHGKIGRDIAWTQYLPPPFKAEEHDDLRNFHISLAITDVPPLIEEPNMPPESALRYRVRFYYRAGPVADFWKDESKFWNKDVEGFLSKRKGIGEALNGLVAPTDAPEQKLKKIYAFVAQMENRNYIPERQKQETTLLGIKVNEGAEDVLRQRSGSHDDLNRLFAALVREAGFSANMMLVPSRDDTFFDEAFLSMNQFEAEIVVVQVAGKDLFFDPGSKFCPYGLLDWRYSGSKGLRQGSGKGPDFVEAPLPGYNQAMIKRVARLKLTEEGKVEGVVGVGFFGIEGMIRRQQGGKTDAEGRKKILEDEVKGWLPAGSEVSLTQEPAWGETETSMVAQFKISAPAAVGAGKRWLLAPHVFQMSAKPMFSAGERVNPVYLYFPNRQIDDLRITLPSSMEIESLPGNRSVKLEYAVYNAEDKQEKKDGTVIVSSRDLAMAGMAFPVKEYAGIKSFYEKVKAGDDGQVILKGSAHAAN